MRFITYKMVLHELPVWSTQGVQAQGCRIVEIGMLDQKRLQEILSYDPETGRFVWRDAAGPQLAGRGAGSIRSGHLTIFIDKKQYMAPRLAWLYVHGAWPATLLRFNDGDPTNVRLNNLRLSVANSERLKDKEAAKAYKKDLQARAGALTQATLKEFLHYDPKTGIFTWLTTGSGRVAGQPAGSVWQQGYRFIHIAGRDHQAARLAWLYVHGEMPEGRVRFDNEDQTDLRIANLRLALTKKELDARFRANNPDANRRYNYTKNYQGMTIEAFDTLLAGQGGVCAICGKAEQDTDNTGTEKVRMMSVDHDHTTGEVRGILCNRHNRALGMFDDSIDLLLAAAAYLERHAKKKAAA